MHEIKIKGIEIEDLEEKMKCISINKIVIGFRVLRVKQCSETAFRAKLSGVNMKKSQENNLLT